MPTHPAIVGLWLTTSQVHAISYSTLSFSANEPLVQPLVQRQGPLRKSPQLSLGEYRRRRHLIRPSSIVLCKMLITYRVRLTSTLRGVQTRCLGLSVPYLICRQARRKILTLASTHQIVRVLARPRIPLLPLTLHLVRHQPHSLLTRIMRSRRVRNRVEQLRLTLPRLSHLGCHRRGSTQRISFQVKKGE